MTQEASFNTRRGLRLWLNTLLKSVRKQGPDLSARQMAILLIVYLEEPPHTVRGLAQKLGVTKPVVTRALDTMSMQGLVRRKRDEADKRSVLVQRTVKGAVFLSDYGDIIADVENDLACPRPRI